MMVGPRRFPSAISLRSGRMESRYPPMSRTLVMPLASKRGTMNLRLPSGSPAEVRWTCMSARPGMRNFPWASRICAPVGMATLFEGPRSEIRCFSMMTVWSESGAAPVMSITVTWVMAKTGWRGGEQESKNGLNRSIETANRARRAGELRGKGCSARPIGGVGRRKSGGKPPHSMNPRIFAKSGRRRRWAVRRKGTIYRAPKEDAGR